MSLCQMEYIKWKNGYVFKSIYAYRCMCVHIHVSAWICVCVYIRMYVYTCVCACVFVHACSVAQSCPVLCNPMDSSPPGSLVHGISQARILEWVSISSSRGRDRIYISCIGKLVLWITTEALYYYKTRLNANVLILK